MLNLLNKHFLVLGLGESGLPTVRWLLAHGASVRVADSRSAPPALPALQAEFPFLQVSCGAFTADLLRSPMGIDEQIIASPGIAVRDLPTDKVVWGDVELFAQAIQSLPSQVVAITGANGKTTVTTLLGECCVAGGLQTVVAGNIGLAVLDALTQVEQNMAQGLPAPDVFVLELSSFQLETQYSLQATAATVLNISEDHMDRYADLTAYAAAKQRIFAPNTLRVLNREDAYCVAMQQENQTLWFGLDAPMALDAYGVVEKNARLALCLGENVLLYVDELQMTGLHNVANVLAVFALLQGIKVDIVAVLATVKAFKGLAHRVEWVKTIHGVDFFDDSKGTNVGATVAALNGMQKPIILVAGGDGKGQDFTPLATAVARICRAVILIGRDAARLRQALQSTGVMLLDALDMQEVLVLAWSQAQAGDIVLLSPACASLDMYRNYAHRAQAFIEAVEILAEQEGVA